MYYPKSPLLGYLSVDEDEMFLNISPYSLTHPLRHAHANPATAARVYADAGASKAGMAWQGKGSDLPCQRHVIRCGYSAKDSRVN